MFTNWNQEMLIEEIVMKGFIWRYIGSLFGEKEIMRNEEKKYSKRRALEKLNTYDLRLKRMNDSE